MSLRDRLTRRATGGATPVVPTPAVQVPSPLDSNYTPQRATPVPRSPQASASSGMYGRRIEVEQISAVDQVKIDLHKKLIERLDLEALEQIPDERLLNSEIRAVVI